MYTIKDKFSLLLLSGVFALVAFGGMVMSQNGFDSAPVLIASGDPCDPDGDPPDPDPPDPPTSDSMPSEIVG